MELSSGIKKINKLIMYFVYIFIYIIFNSCQENKNDNNCIYYKYFDEYLIKGISKIDNINNFKGKYYVSILSTKDSIILNKISENKIIERVVYLNKKGFWEISIINKNIGNNKTFKGITNCEKKIIYNDTIYNYKYNLIEGKYASGCLEYSTKDKIFYCFDCGIDDIRNVFNVDYAVKYFKKCTNYEIYNKKYVKNRMFVYYEDGTLFDVRSYNFGYFDSDKNYESYIDEY